MSDWYVEIPKKKPLLSLILYREGVLSQEQYELALRLWATRRNEGKVMAFGQIVLSLGYLKAHELVPYVELQKALAAPPSKHKPMGTLIIENGLMKPSRLFYVLKRQKAMGCKLGELLMQEGFLRRNQIEILLRFQGKNLAFVGA